MKEPQPGDAPRKAPHGRRLAVLLAVLAVTGAATVGAVEFDGHAHRPAGAPTDAAKVTTATVTRTDLSDTRTLPGTLGYGPPTPVVGRGSGVVTALPAAGSTVSRGRTLYRADDQPVVLFYGATPLFRTLKPPAGASAPVRGRDVTVVADNLRALGYDVGPREPDPDATGDTYTASLAAAVRRWQRDAGLPRTGTLGAGQAVVLPGAVRIGSVQARLGDPVQETLMSVTSTGRTVSVPVEAGDAAGIVKGQRVTITLPDDRAVPGTVASVSQTVAAGGPGGDGGAGGGQDGEDAPPTLNVAVAPLRPADVASLASAPVQVAFTTRTRRGVLAVPVTALVALKEGGYALQRPDGTLVAVTTGLFAAGRVEVGGPGVRAGMLVEAAS